MLGRTSLLYCCSLCSAISMAQAPDGSLPQNETAESRVSSDTAVTDKEAEVTVGDAIRLATEALDRLESGGKQGSDSMGLKAALDEARRYIEVVETRDPDNPRILFLYGRAHALTGRQGDAVEQLRKFVQTREGRNEWRAYLLLGDLFVSRFPQLAKGNYEKAAQLKADEPGVLFGLATCAIKLGRGEEAISLARQAVKTDGRHTVRYVARLASLLRVTGKLEEAQREAVSALDLALREMGDRPGERGALANVDVQYGLLIEIVRGRIAERGHDDIEDYPALSSYVRGQVAVKQKLALHSLLQVIQAGVDKTAPDTPPVLLEQYGIILSDIDRTGEAIAVFTELLTVDPQNATALEQLRRLRP